VENALIARSSRRRSPVVLPNTSFSRDVHGANAFGGDRSAAMRCMIAANKERGIATSIRCVGATPRRFFSTARPHFLARSLSPAALTIVMARGNRYPMHHFRSDAPSGSCYRLRTRHPLSPGAFYRIPRVARTIAGLAGNPANRAQVLLDLSIEGRCERGRKRIDPSIHRFPASAPTAVPSISRRRIHRPTQVTQWITCGPPSG